MPQLQEVDAVVLGVLLAFTVAGVCLTPWSIGDIASLLKRRPNDEVGEGRS